MTSKTSHPRYFDNIYLPTEHTEFDACHALRTLMDHFKSLVQEIRTHKPPNPNDVDGGLYVGSTGIAYTFLYLSQGTFLSTEEAQEYFLLARNYLEGPLNNVLSRKSHNDNGFLLGDAGTVAVGAVMAEIGGNVERANTLAKMYIDFGENYKQINFFRHGSDEFFVGRAGYLFGAMWINRQLGREAVPIKLMHDIAKVIIESGKAYAQKHESPCPLMYAYYGTEYLGAAHGLSTILQALIQVPSFLNKNREANDTVKACVNYLLRLQNLEGNFPCTPDEVNVAGQSTRKEKDDLVHWCHGAPGIVYLMAAAYLRWKDEQYLHSCIRTAPLIWKKGLLKKGPGICHGIAGNGYVFLLLYRLTTDQTYVQYAIKFQQFMQSDQFKKEARIPDEPFSLYEGLAGTLCFITDLLQPDSAAFPFQNVH